MKKISMSVMVLAMSVMLTGCQTLVCTVSGPFIGLEKDMQNFGNAVNNMTRSDLVTGKSKLDNADAWMQKNLW